MLGRDIVSAFKVTAATDSGGEAGGEVKFKVGARAGIFFKRRHGHERGLSAINHEIIINGKDTRIVDF